MANTESSIAGNPEFECDLRVQGVPEDEIYKDEEQMTETNEKLGNMTFSEESRRVIFEMGNVKLFELGKFEQQISAILALSIRHKE